MADQVAEPVLDKDQLPYKLARCLVESAKSEWQKKSKPFKSHWDYLLGRNHWAVPETAAAQAMDEWTCKSIRNWMFATVDHKNSVIQDATPTLHVDPLDEESTYQDRAQIKAAVLHELARLRADEVHEDVYLWASTVGVGASLITKKPDSITGRMLLRAVPVNMAELYPDPFADNREKCEFMVWEPDLPMSVWRAMFGSKADSIKPTGNSMGQIPEISYKPDNTNDNLVYGSAQEYAVDKTGVSRRSAKGCFVWQKDPDALSQELKKRLLSEPEAGYQCVSCQLYAESDAVESEDGTNPCPLCQGDMAEAEIPQGTQVQKTVFTKMYPYGRLTIYSGETLLFDGPNPDEIEEVFPFAFYPHYRVPGSFLGYGDVALLKSPQDVADKNGGMIVDATRLASFGIFEHPAGAIVYNTLGNRPGTRAAVKDHLSGKARWIMPQGINVEMWRTVDSMNQRDFQIVGGVTNLGFGITSSPVVSATEAEGALTNQSVRLKGHARRFDRYRSDFISIVVQMARQYYTDPVSVPMQDAKGEMTIQEIEWSKLPRCKVRVTSDVQAAQFDKLVAQNIQSFISGGGLDSPFADVILTQYGADPQQVKELMDRRGLLKEQEGGPPPPKPTDPANVLASIANVIKARPDAVAFTQIQEALANCGLQPVQEPDQTAPKPPEPQPTIHIHQPGSEVAGQDAQSREGGM